MRSDLKGRGLGWELMQMIEWAKATGSRRSKVRCCARTRRCSRCAARLGFGIRTDPADPDVKIVTLPIAAIDEPERLSGVSGPA